MVAGTRSIVHVIVRVSGSKLPATVADRPVAGSVSTPVVNVAGSTS